MHLLKTLCLLAIVVSSISCTETRSVMNKNGEMKKNAKSQKRSNVVSKKISVWPRLKSEVPFDPVIEDRITDLMKDMTVAQKVAQMIQPEIRDITVEDMRQYGFGSYLNGGGAYPNNNKHSTPQDWIELAEKMYQASIDAMIDGSQIPTMWGTDAVHGHNNVIGATLFPHNIGLGATNNPELIEKIARATAVEVMATGIDWVFAPTVATVRDDRWGRTYEGYSEDPEIVKAYSKSIVHGLQGRYAKDFLADDKVISTVKHFLGDGGTVDGVDQGNNLAEEEELFKIHAQGYVGGLSAGAQTVMASFNSWHGDKIHGDKYLLTDVLKEKMGFDGLVVGDWNGHGQIEGCSNESCPQAINAGLDIFMAPTSSWKPLYHNTIKQVEANIIPMSRIDDAVRRILRVKIRAGIFEKPSPKNRAFSGKIELIGAEPHREIARQAVRESLVLLKNKENILPLSPKQKILVVGDGANNIGKQSGGWTITWQGTGNVNSEFPRGSSIYDGIQEQVTVAGGEVELSEDGNYQKKPDVAIVVFGEEPYAEGHGDIDDLEFQRGDKKDLKLLRKLRSQNIPVVSLFISGRPLWVNAEINQSDAFVAVWLPGSEGKAVADVILKDKSEQVQYDFKGKLSFSWPKSSDQAVVNHQDENYSPLLPYGFGLQYGQENYLADNLSEEKTFSEDRTKEVVFFERSTKPPFKSFISDSEKTAEINANTAKNKSVSYRTRDRFVQEDSVEVNFTGKDHGKFGFHEAFPNDLRGFFEANASISMELMVDRLPTKPLYLSMSCEGGCTSSVDITKVVSEIPLNKWSTISVPLKCFDMSSAQAAKVIAPLVFQTEGQLSMQLFDARLGNSQKSVVAVDC